MADPVGEPSAFFGSHEQRLRGTQRIGRTLDLACGRGRHALASARLGLDVLAVDRNAESLEELERVARTAALGGVITTRLADLEAPSHGATRPDPARPSHGAPRPDPARPAPDIRPPPDLSFLEPRSFGAVLVFRYLHRPLMPWIESLVAPGGILLYETFTTEQRRLGWGPRRDDFLLRPGELPTLLSQLDVEVYEEGPSLDEPSAMTARLLGSRR